MANEATNAAVISLSGRIDSNNAPQIEADILAELKEKGAEAVVLDAQKL